MGLTGVGTATIASVTAPISFATAADDPSCAVPGTWGSYRDEDLADILRRARTVAMVGASTNPIRPSSFVFKYLTRKGYHVIPVNPMAAGQEILGVPVVGDLRDIDEPIDVVDVFRRADAVPGIVDTAIEVGAKVVWLQLGIRDDAFADRLRQAGIKVVQDRCLMVEHRMRIR